jgi:predicted DNA-binding transcriptional regulator AlpA
MAVETLADPRPSDKPLALLKPFQFRQRRNISRSQEYHLLKTDPDFPRPVVINGQRYYVEHEATAYIQALIATRDQKNGGD